MRDDWKKDEKVMLIEELSLNAHPSLNTVYYDGWYIRFGEGYTYRANSVNMLYPSTLPIEEKINVCEEMYRKQKLSTAYKITPFSMGMDELLAKRGYEVITKTNIMVADISKGKYGTLTATVTDKITKEWQENDFRLVNYEESTAETARKIHRNIVFPSLCATISCGNEIVACGLCVVERGYAGIYNIIVSEAHRRNGYGRDICASLLNRAAELGADKAYLQVVDENEKAKRLYEKLGFTNSYQYWYRVKKYQ